MVISFSYESAELLSVQDTPNTNPNWSVRAISAHVMKDILSQERQPVQP